MARTKRGYSYDFTPRSERDVHLSLRRVPPTLHRSFKAKCKDEGLSMRYVVLSWVRNWIAGRRPDENSAELHTSAREGEAQPFD